MKNNVALITGASSGIGKELAYIHAEKGYDLVIVARNQQKLKEIKSDLENKYNVQVKTITKDLSKSAAPKEVYDEVKSAGIEVEYLINNAGFGGHGKFHERDWEKRSDDDKLKYYGTDRFNTFFSARFCCAESW
jgi:short-subunit dehydrogenase